MRRRKYVNNEYDNAGITDYVVYRLQEGLITSTNEPDSAEIHSERFAN